MRRFCFLLLCVLCGIAPAETLSHWSAGVTPDSGWYDFNKSFESGEQGDSLLCWAAVASNLLAWWQHQNAALVPQPAPQGEQIWQCFRDSFENEGGDPDQGIRWWFHGKYTPENPGEGLRTALIRQSARGGFLSETCSAVERLLYCGRGVCVTADLLTETLLSGFRRGDAFWIGVSLFKPDGRRFMHSLNVWGIDVEDNRIKAVYMCDSDDARCELHRLPVVESEGQLWLDCNGHPLYGKIGRALIDTYTGLRLSPAE